MKRRTISIVLVLCLSLSLIGTTGRVFAYPAAYTIPALTGNQAQDAANIAKSQLGYNGASGTVYGAWWNTVTNWGVDYTYSGWCAMFACWCANQAGAGFGYAYNKNGASPSLLLDWYKNNATADTSFGLSPTAGDFIFFGSAGGSAEHVAVVTGYTSGTRKVSFVGGNQGSASGGSVTSSSVTYSSGTKWGSQYVIGIGRPKYANTPVNITVTFNANGGSCSTNTKSLCPGSAIGDLPVPAKNGYDFAGWYIKDSYGKSNAIKSTSTFTNSTTLYALWATRVYTGSLVDFQGSDLGKDKGSMKYSGINIGRNTGDLVVYNCAGQIVRTDIYGGEFVVDSTGKVVDVRYWGDEEFLTVPEGGFVLSAKGANTEALRFIDTIALGDYIAYSLTSGKIWVYPTRDDYLRDWKCVHTGEPYGVLPTPTRDGYDFAGWYAKDSYGRANPITESTIYQGENVLYALWATRVYTGMLADFICEGTDLGKVKESMKYSGINTERNTGDLVIYNCAGQVVRTDIYGGEFVVDSTGKVVNVRYWGDEDYLTVPEGGFVLSARGANTEAIRFIDKIALGDYIAYSLNSGKVFVYSTQNDYLKDWKCLHTGEPYGMLPTPTRDGYDFAGWYAKDSYGRANPITESTIYQGEKMLYALWASRVYTGMLADFVCEGSDLGKVKESMEYTGVNTGRDTGDLVIYNCAGQTVRTDVYGGEVIVDSIGKVVYKRYWGDEDQITVPEGGFVLSARGAQTDAMRFMDKIIPGDYVAYSLTSGKVWVYSTQNDYLKHWKCLHTGEPYGQLPVPTKDGYEFVGWFTRATGGEQITEDSIYNGVKVLYAQWNCNHSWALSESKEPTCNEDGSEIYTCTNCGEIKTESIALLGHMWDEGLLTLEPTETSEGVKTYTCLRCGERVTETIPVLEHKHCYIETVVLPTCTEQGYTSHICSGCGDSYNDNFTESTDHRFVYTNKDEYHEIRCDTCAYSSKEEHSFNGGCCACGATEFIDPIIDERITINHSLNLASDISVNYVVRADLLTDYDNFQLDVQIPVYQGNEFAGNNTITLKPVLNGSYYYFTMADITAVQMNDILIATLRMQKEDQEYFSKQDSYSVATYALNQLNKTGVAEPLKTLCADLLRYGATAQTFKNYRTDALATNGMTEAHKVWFSNLDDVSFGNTNTVYNDLALPMITWIGKTLNLGSKVVVKFVFNAGAYTGDISNLTLRMVYKDGNGTYQTITLSNPIGYNESNRQYAFEFDGLMAAELRTPLSVAVYNGDTQLSQTLQYSPDTYGNNKTGVLGELCKALFAYSDSAKKYFS